MPRNPRQLRNNSIHYIETQSFNEYELFLSDEDNRRFIKLLKDYKIRFKIKILGFCLLPQSIHLVLYAELGSNVSAFMQGIIQSYAIYFNKINGKKGKVWADRYKNIGLFDYESLLKKLKEIEFKPVKENLIDSPVNYPWSSCIHRVVGHPNEILDNLRLTRDILKTNPMPHTSSVLQSQLF